MFNNKKVKFLSVMLVCIMLILGSTGCSNQSSSKDGGSTNKKEKTEIVFWHNWETGPSGESIKKSVEKFNETHPNIEVKPVYVAPDGGDSVSSKLLTAVAGGNPPDVMLASRYGIAEYKDAITPVTDLAKEDNITKDMFYPWAWGEATYEDELLALPYDGTSRALFYNKDHFREAGLDPENPPTTIDGLEKAAEKLTKKKDGNYTRFGLIPWFGEGWLYTWGWAFGGKFVDGNGTVTANDPKIVNALKWETNFAKKYGIQDVTSFVSSAGSNATNPFMTGQLSMMISGNWMLSQIEEYAPDLDYGVSYIPTPTGDDFTTFVGGRVLLIPKGVKHLDASWEFVKWMCANEEGQSFKKITGEFAAMPDVNEKLYGDDPQQKKFLEVLPNGKHRPVVLAGNMMWDELAKAPDLVMNGKGTPQGILDDINEKINKEIKSKKAKAN
ncbi:multiple sugar transport system substrate-binding protein [Pullulanibacillus pueri]|uniref:Sugar ABC transporter substrate-binding protein n=1 Tax=Pullulanibacillus pueri TaxID=1437324 RepID=A0A8J2ZYZ2_9BACL|nr:ABC transporter substrate-binding protein [Pullulanibacillus pueri]MBM7683551.1 multiple sugar transport system substrate-binding protein [Pullulanibacillus pueri]GGH86842.1 sugar ABC transporter substrate-binding protein [Pullulanibacillus pueri]